MRRSLCWRGYKTRRSSAELLPTDVALQRFKSKFLCRDAKWLQLGFVCTDKIVVCLKEKKEKKFQWFFLYLLQPRTEVLRQFHLSSYFCPIRPLLNPIQSCFGLKKSVSNFGVILNNIGEG